MNAFEEGGDDWKKLWCVHIDEGSTMGSVSSGDIEHDLDVIAKSNDMGWSLTGA
jgi:hypothetical protein